MIKVSYDEIINKIVENSNLSKDDIESKVKDKMGALAGLISKEGAAHIIANELGVKVLEQTSGKLKIKSILPGMRNLEIDAKVRAVYELREFVRKTDGAKGKVANFIVADDTDTIRVVMWGNVADKIKNIKQDDVVSIKNANARENNGRKELHLYDDGELIINPEGVSIINVVGGLTPEARRVKISELSEDSNNVEIMGTIVQLFDPNFFEVCPECGKRIRPREDGFYCEQHMKVTPSYSFVFNVMLDDGTGTVRVAFFRRAALELLGKSDDDILEFKDHPDKYEPIKTELLGKIIKVVGRARSSMFNGVEFSAYKVFSDIDPDDEIKRLDEEIGKLNLADDVAVDNNKNDNQNKNDDDLITDNENSKKIGKGVNELNSSSVVNEVTNTDTLDLEDLETLD